MNLLQCLYHKNNIKNIHYLITLHDSVNLQLKIELNTNITSKTQINNIFNHKQQQQYKYINSYHIKKKIIIRIISIYINIYR